VTPIIPNPVRAVIFDLDGTLADTATEIHAALALAFGELGVEALSLGEVQALVGRGVRSLVERALRKRGSEHDVDATVERFEQHYARLVATEAEPYPGVIEGVRRLHGRGLKLAVVTNKPRYFTEKLLARVGVDRMIATVVAGDDGIRRKPAGDMLLAACARMESPAVETLMLGDSDNDVTAARAAGCPVWCVPYGYNEGKPPETLACDRLVGSVAEAAALILAEAT